MSWTTGAVELAAVAVALAAVPARAQTPDLDVAKVDPAHHKVEFENDQVRVVRWVIGPHDKAPLHGHPALVSVLLTDVNARATGPDGKTSEVHGKAGAVAWREPLVHVYENVGEKPISGILVEPKGRGNAAWKAPLRDDATVDPAHHKIEFENDRVRVDRYWYGPGEKSPMHDHATHVQIALTETKVRATAPDGKVTENHLVPGQVRFREAFSHAVENTGSERFEGILVVLKNAPPPKSGTR